MYEYEFESTSMNINWLITQAHKAMHRSLEPQLAMQQSTREQSEVLFFTSMYPDGVTAAELAEWCFCRRAAINRLTQRMDKAGFIKVEPQLGKRHFLYKITEKGEELLHQYLKASSPIARQLEPLFSEAEVLQLTSLLKRVRDEYLRQSGLHAKPPSRPVQLPLRRRSVDDEK